MQPPDGKTVNRVAEKLRGKSFGRKIIARNAKGNVTVFWEKIAGSSFLVTMKDCKYTPFVNCFLKCFSYDVWVSLPPHSMTTDEKSILTHPQYKDLCKSLILFADCHNLSRTGRDQLATLIALAMSIARNAK